MSGYKALSMCRFLRDTEEELDSFDTISNKNCVAIHQLKKNALLRSTMLGSSDNKDLFDKLVQLKKENVSQKNMLEEQKLKMVAMTAGTKKKEKEVVNLEKKLGALTEEYEKLVIERKKEDREARDSIKIFEKALKFYTTYFQYTIEEGSMDDGDKFCAIITFILEGKLSQYPIRIVFDKQIGSLISFDAGDLLNEKQHEVLWQRFRDSGNYLALFSTLRHAAIIRHT